MNNSDHIVRKFVHPRRHGGHLTNGLIGPMTKNITISKLQQRAPSALWSVYRRQIAFSFAAGRSLQSFARAYTIDYICAWVHFVWVYMYSYKHVFTWDADNGWSVQFLQPKWYRCDRNFNTCYRTLRILAARWQLSGGWLMGLWLRHVTSSNYCRCELTLWRARHATASPSTKHFHSQQTVKQWRKHTMSIQRNHSTLKNSGNVKGLATFYCRITWQLSEGCSASKNLFVWRAKLWRQVKRLLLK